VKFNSVQARLGLLFAGFAALVIVSVVTTMKGIAAQSQDGQVINLAGRQRMLIQAMARSALAYEQDGDEKHLANLKQDIEGFENTLDVLENGGISDYAPLESPSGDQVEILPPTQDIHIRTQLAQVRVAWGDYRAGLELVMAGDLIGADLNAAIAVIQSQASPMLTQADRLVGSYESAAAAKIRQLRLIQLLFLAAAAVLLGLGGFLVQFSILKPLKDLSLAARRIGSGDLFTPVQASGLSEIHLLAETIENMRIDLNQTHQELLTWAEDLEAQVARRTQELEALFTVSRDISSHLDISDVLVSVTEQARQLLSGEVAFLCLLGDDGENLRLHANSGAAQAIRQSSSPVRNSLAAQVLTGDRALRCGETGCRQGCQIISSAYQTSHLAAPLRMGNRTIGALCVSSSRPEAFKPESSGQLTKLAQAAAVALENARLYQAAERTAMLEERQRIAAEMHDGLAQSISAIQMAVDLARMQILKRKYEQAADVLSKSRMAIEQANIDIRRAISSLQEDFPLQITLQDQLAGLIGELNSQSARVSWEDNTLTPLVLPHPQGEQIMRVAREALLNACNHGHAEHIILRLGVTDGYGILAVQDDGQGFEVSMPENKTQNGNHFGLQIMQARAARISGHLEIQSQPSTGTCVQLTWPLDQTNGNGGTT
jgi:nitrate/nitrite-specific signal transduction histidine kinase